MSTQPSLFDITRRKSHGSGLSDEANLRVQKEIDVTLALSFIRGAGRRGSTLHEVCWKMGYGLAVNRMSGRITELLKAKKIYRTVESVDPVTGKERYERGEYMGKVGSVYRAVN